MKTVFAAALLFAAHAANAADAPASTAGLATAATAATAATSVTVPAAAAKPGTRSRADVHAEAVDAVKHHKTALALQLEQYK